MSVDVLTEDSTRVPKLGRLAREQLVKGFIQVKESEQDLRHHKLHHLAIEARTRQSDLEDSIAAFKDWKRPKEFDDLVLRWGEAYEDARHYWEAMFEHRKSSALGYGETLKQALAFGAAGPEFLEASDTTEASDS